MRALLLVLVAIPVLSPRASHEVTAGGTSFSPKTVEVAVGDTVTWRNSGGTHSVRFDDGSYDSGEPTTAAVLGERTFTEAGSFAYYCELHGLPGGRFMSGTVVVGDAAAPEPVSVDGLTVRKRLRDGRLRGLVDVAPAGTDVTVEVRHKGARVGRLRGEASPGTTPFAVKLPRPLRERLADKGSLKVTVVVAAGDASARRTVTLRG